MTLHQPILKGKNIIKKNRYLHQLAHLLNVNIEELTNEFVLQNSQLWDSLSIVSTIASIDRHFHVAVKGDELEGSHTIGDIFKLIEKKQQKSTRNIYKRVR